MMRRDLNVPMFWIPPCFLTLTVIQTLQVGNYRSIFFLLAKLLLFGTGSRWYFWLADEVVCNVNNVSYPTYLSVL